MAEPQHVKMAGGTYIAIVLTLILAKSCGIENRLKSIEAKLPAAAPAAPPSAGRQP